MPLYYGNKETGVVLTKFYSKIAPEKYPFEEQDRLVNLLRIVGVCDMHFNNFRVTETGQLVAIDIGHTFGAVKG